MHAIKVLLLAAAAMAAGLPAGAQPFRLENVPAVAAVPPHALKPDVILFADLRAEKSSDAAGELMSFADWTRSQPLRQRLLSLFPEFREPVLSDGSRQRLSVYVAEARFRMARPAQAFDARRYAGIDFLEKLDPAITHKPLSAADAIPNKEDTAAHNRAPGRRWCEEAACFQSRYKFEGKIPAGIMLVNKLRDESKRPIPDFIDFQSEIRALRPTQNEAAEIAQLTGLDTAVAGVLEMNIFWVNQVIQSGKILAVVQPLPGDAGASVATIYLALAIRSDVLEKQRDFLNAPILRNLVPAQLLMGRSSFNNGNSVSAGLPQFARGRIAALAAMIGRE